MSVRIKNRLNEHFAVLDSIIVEGDSFLRCAAPQLSGWDIGQHVDHTLKVCDRIFKLVEEGKALDGPRISFVGRAVLFIGRIPRGRGKSPDAVVGTVASAAELHRTLIDVQALGVAVLSDRAAAAAASKILRHPYFGNLTAPQALRFCEVHMRHHLRIIADIKECAAMEAPGEC